MNTEPVLNTFNKVQRLYEQGKYGKAYEAGPFFDLSQEAYRQTVRTRDVYDEGGAQANSPEVVDQVGQAKKAVDAVAGKIQSFAEGEAREAVKAFVKACRHALDNLGEAEGTASQGVIEGSTELSGHDLHR